MKKFLKRVLIVIIVLAVLIGVAVPFVPRILSAYAPGLIVDAIAPSVSGTVTVDAVALSWGGPQEIMGLRIVDAAGTEAVAVDLEVDAGLLDLLSIVSIDAKASGVLRSTWEEDGSFSVADLLAASDEPAAEVSSKPGAGAAAPSRGLPDVAVDCAGLRVELDVRDGRNVPLVIEGLIGHAALSSRDIDVKLASAIVRGDERGEIRVDARLDDVLGSDGGLTPGGAVVACSIALTDVPMPFQDEAPTASGVITIGAEDLAAQLDIDVALTAALSGGADPSELRADLVVFRPFAADGTVDIRPERIEGILGGEAIPAALLEPFLPADLPIILARDLGRTLEATAIFGSGTPRDVHVNVKGEHVDATVRGAIDGETGALTGGTVVVRGTVSPELLAAFGEITATGRPVLVIGAKELTYPSFTALRDDPAVLAGEIEVSLTGDVTLRTGSSEQPIDLQLARAQLNAASDGAGIIEPIVRIRGVGIDGEVEATARLTSADRLDVDRMSGSLTTNSAQLIEWLDLQEDDPRPRGRVAAVIEAQPFALERSDDSGWAVASDRDARAMISLEPLAVSAPQLSAPIDVREIRIEATRTGDGTMRAQGTAALASQGRGLGMVEADASLASGADAPSGRISLRELDVAGLETLLTMTSGTAVAWLGSSGDVVVDLIRPEASTWRIGLEFPEAEGIVDITPSGDVLIVRSEELTARLAPEVLGSMVVAKGEESAFELVAPLPISALVNDVALPLAMLSGDPFDPALLAGSIELTGGPLALVTLDGLPVALDEITLTLDASNVANKVPMRLSASMPADGSGKAGSAALDGRLVNLFDDDGVFSPSLAGYSGDATFTRVPTDLIDGLVALEGRLVAAIGDVVDGSAEAAQFSKRTGWAEFDLTSPNGFVRGRIRATERELGTSKVEERQLHGALVLTPEFSREILGFLTPVFSDVHSTERPITFRVTSAARLPHDGDASLIHGDIDLDVGPVAFEPSGDLLGLLALFGESTGTVAGRIDPAHFIIRKGVVTFDDLVVHMNKFSIPFNGSVDLATDTVSMRWKVPIEQLAKTFHELEGLEGITVPLVTSSAPGGAIKTDLAPEFAETLLEIGVQKGIEELIKGIGGGG